MTTSADRQVAPEGEVTAPGMRVMAAATRESRTPLRAIKLSLLAVIAACCLTKTAAGEAKLWGDLASGGYDVGFRVARFGGAWNDDNGNSAGMQYARPIEVMMWYPVRHQDDDAMRLQFRDYVVLADDAGMNYDEADVMAWLSTMITGEPEAIDAETATQILESSMRAIRDAPPYGQQFPLVLWTMRHNTMIAQSVLSEYLASHGLVVVFARFGGARLPFPWEIESPDEKERVFINHYRDLEASLEFAGRSADVDASQVGVISWSYAAELSPRLQVNYPQVKVVIGLSSNPLNEWGLYQGEGAAAVLMASKLNVPYVIMSEKIGSDGKERQAPGLLANLPGESFFLSFDGLRHGNFNVLEGMIPGVFGIDKVQSWSTGGDAAKAGYETISQYALAFLNRYLKPDDRAQGESGSAIRSSESVTVTAFAGPR